MIECYKCDREPSIRECGRCRLVLKYDLVKRVLEMDPVYLSEDSRNKHGRPSLANDPHLVYEVRKAYQKYKSCRKVAEYIGVSKSTVSKIMRMYGELK